MTNKLNLACDYNQGAHPAILKQMLENNLVKSGVYGEDAFSESAKARIREACKAPEADVWFLVGGTQTNAVVLDSVLRPYEGVISVETGHICIHEARRTQDPRRQGTKRETQCRGHSCLLGHLGERRESGPCGEARCSLSLQSDRARHALYSSGT